MVVGPPTHESEANTWKVPETVGVNVPFVLSVTLELLTVVQPIPVSWTAIFAPVVPVVVEFAVI